ncbi:MAG: signal peptidase II [Gemmatimonadales bacterium]
MAPAASGTRKSFDPFLSMTWPGSLRAPKTRAFLASAIPLLAADRISKSLAYARLQPIGIPHQVIGNGVRFTLLLNRDAAMNLSLGPWSRWGFAAIAVIGIAVVLRLQFVSAEDARSRGIALGLIAAGALGNLIDRLRWSGGVVDFIDLGLARHRFWTFNVADAGVIIGAVLLALVFSREPPTPASANAVSAGRD